MAVYPAVETFGTHADDPTTLPEPSAQILSLPLAPPVLHAPSFDIVQETDPRYTRLSDGGLARDTTTRFRDGSLIDLRKIYPKNQQWDRTVDMPLPLALHIDGYADILGRHIADKTGSIVRIIGTNQARGFTLLHDSYASLALLQHDDEQAGDEVHQAGESIGHGFSMGCMKWLAMLGLAEQFNRNVPALIGIDPCMADQVKSGIHANTLPSNLLYFCREGLGIAEATIDDFTHLRPDQALRRALELSKSVGVSPKELRNTHDKLVTLSTGETGRLLPLVPRHATGVIHVLKGSRYNDDETYESNLSGTHLRFHVQNGMHVAPIADRVINNIVEQIETAQHLVEADATPAEIAEELDYPIAA